MQWWKVTKYAYSITVFKYNSEVLEYFSFMLLFISTLHYISEGNKVHFTLLHLFDSYSYCALPIQILILLYFYLSTVLKAGL